MGTKAKRGFIELNGPPSGYKVTHGFLKADLLSMYGSAYPSHFRRIFYKKYGDEAISNVKNYKQN